MGPASSLPGVCAGIARGRDLTNAWLQAGIYLPLHPPAGAEDGHPVLQPESEYRRE